MAHTSLLPPQQSPPPVSTELPESPETPVDEGAAPVDPEFEPEPDPGTGE